jgi:hypothetical protein
MTVYMVFAIILASEDANMREMKIMTRHEVKCIIEKYRITIGRWIIRGNGLIDVDGSCEISHSEFSRLPLYFGTVTGNFYCHSNKLTSLKGCPDYVGGDFICYGNNLKALKYAPIEVGGNFSCHENNLKNLKGCPRHIKGNFNCFLNQIITLKDGPNRVEGNYDAYLNQLISLKGSPVHIGGSFNVSGNRIKNLVGCPEYIGEFLSFDNTVSIFMNQQNCEVKEIEIQIQDQICEPDFFLPQVIIDNKKYLPIIFKYNQYLELFSEEMVFNDVNFNDIVLDIKEGLR